MLMADSEQQAYHLCLARPQLLSGRCSKGFWLLGADFRPAWRRLFKESVSCLLVAAVSHWLSCWS